MREKRACTFTMAYDILPTTCSIFFLVCMLMVSAEALGIGTLQISAEALHVLVVGPTLPPWRGPRQLLAIGPWGSLFDFGPGNVSLYVESDGSTKRIPSSKLPPRPANHRRIVAISDTHGKHRFIKIPPCDVLCHCGDILQRYGYIGDLGGGIPALIDFASWLRTVPADNAVVIGGNHDRLLEKLGDSAVRSILKQSGATYLRDSSAKVADLKFFGSPWSPSGGTGNKAFQSGVDAANVASKALGKCSPDDEGGHIDVLLTHASCKQWEALSSRASFWAHGHWHDGQGSAKIIDGGCVSINVASNDMIYRPRNPPIVFDVPLFRKTSSRSNKSQRS